jgi:hypothetical protein
MWHQPDRRPVAHRGALLGYPEHRARAHPPDRRRTRPRAVGAGSQPGGDRRCGRPMAGLIAGLLVMALLVACGARASPQPPVTEAPAGGPGTVLWDPNPSTLIVRFYSPSTTAGLAGAFDRRYYIPEVQLWGDGRIIWVVREGAGRRVMAGRLTTEQMETLLGRIVAAGFFEWEEAYYTPGGHSFPPMHLLVNLADRSKEISEHGGAPEAYYELEEVLLSGAGAEGHDYEPMQGYLTVSPGPAEVAGPAWPDWAAVTPDQVAEGTTVAGETLAYVWDLVNRNPTAPVYVSHEGKTYQIMVQIRGVSYFEPPAE